MRHIKQAAVLKKRKSQERLPFRGRRLSLLVAHSSLLRGLRSTLFPQECRLFLRFSRYLSK